VNGQRLVDDISVTVPAGAIVAVVGPSGAGKTSFLRLLNRLNEPTAGEVILASTDYTMVPPQELRCRVCMMMQQPYMFPGTVADNIRYGPRQRGESLSEDTIADLLRQVNLDGYGSRDAATLSVGEAQRVSLARALANDPQVLLLDEPTSALDRDSVADAERLIRQVIRERDLTCLIITHDMAQAQRMADHALVIREGKLVGFGPITEVLDADALDR
jgi:putative ABC transport system ATP-binding protein